MSTDKQLIHEDPARICQWSEALRECAHIKNGWLREVYPLNYLSNAHLNAPVGDHMLRQWILEDADRGTMAPVTSDLMLWDVPDDRIGEISKELMAAGRVFDYMRDIVAHWPPPTPMTMQQAVGTVAQAFGFDSPDDVEIRTGDNMPISEEHKAEIFKKKPED